MWVGQLALPYDHDAPAKGTKLPLHTAVAQPVALQLGSPELNARRRRRSAPATGVAVPEAAMHEDHLGTRREHQVGAAR